jgi:hypothetical protein
MLDVLSAHVCFETGRGDRMHNHNFGGIKGQGPKGSTATAATSEYANGVEIRIRDQFRAYDSLLEGATDYLTLMRSRYRDAFAAADRGDVDGFVRALHDRGYFTAPKEVYAQGLRSLFAEAASGGIGAAPPSFEAAAAADAAPALPTGDAAILPSAAAVARVLQAVSSMALRISQPLDDEET